MGSKRWFFDLSAVFPDLPFIETAGITRDILGRIVLLWDVAGSNRWSCFHGNKIQLVSMEMQFSYELLR